jgi:hypothetical protein
VTVDDGRGEVDELAVGSPRLLAEHLEGDIFVYRVALHQDALGSLDQGAPAECSLQVLVLGKAAQDDVDRALPFVDIRISDVPQGGELRDLDPAEFTTQIDNPYWLMAPGSKWVYGEPDSEGARGRIELTIPERTKRIANGIEAPARPRTGVRW